MGTVLHPTAGFIADLSRGAHPGRITAAERALLRSLAARVREIAEEPRQAVLKEGWTAHGDLRPVRPMLFTVRRDPRRVEEGTRIARQEIERSAA